MRLLRLVSVLVAIACCSSARAAEENRNYPLGPIGGQFRISGGDAYARVVSLTGGAPGATAGLQVGDYIIGAFGKAFTPTGSFHYGVTQDLGFAVDRAEGNGGQLPLQLLRPGVGGIDLTVNLPADGAFSAAYPRNDAKSKQLFDSAVAWLHTKTMSGNGNMGYFTGWTGLALLGHPDWNATTGPRPYRLSINKIRDSVVAQINGATFAPVENLLIDGTDNPNYAGQVTISNWELGQKVMFLSEYYAKTNDAAVVTPLQRGVEICANTIQWWKQPALASNGYSPGYEQIAGMVSHGGVTGDYVHLGWGGGINMTGVYSYNGMAFARSAGMNMAAQPRDGHYFGFAQCPAGVVPVGMENKDHTIDEKFLMQTNWMVNRCGGFGSGDEDGHICYTLQGWSSWDAGGRTPATLLGLAMYQRDGGTLDANYINRLERMKGYITRQYMKHQEAHAYSVGAQAYQQFAAAFLSDRQQRFFMDNWRFYYALAQTPDGGFQYFRARTVNDNYLDETHCAALNAALPYAIANGGISLIPAYKSDRLLARFDNPEITWPSLDARRVTLTGTGTLPMPLAIVDGDGTVLNPAEYSLSWSKISGPGTVTFNSNNIVFGSSGTYRVQMTATRGERSVVEPIVVSVGMFNPPPGYAMGKADYQVFTGISGMEVADLTSAAKFPNSPDIVRTVTSAVGDYSGDSYGARLSGAIIPPVTGSYRFYIAADDTARLSLNSSGMAPSGASVIATVPEWTDANQWNNYPSSQRSALINLTAGQAVWFEALHKEGAGGDNLSVGWSINGGPIEVIDGINLAAVSAQEETMAFVTHPASASAAPGDTITLTATTTGPTPAIYQWRRNGNPIGSAGSNTTLTLTNVSGGAEGNYDVVYTSTAGTLTSNAAHVTITGTGATVTGGLWREVYTDIGGGSVSNLTSNAKFPNFSDTSGPITSAAGPSNYADSYGERWTGWITPAFSGNYRFYLASDDDSEIWLGTNEQPASASRILTLSGYTNEKQWSARSPSSYIAMTAGVRYYIQVLHKDGGGGDHCAVAWQRQGTSAPTNGSGEIPGSVLSYRDGGIYDDISLESTAPAFSTDPVLGAKGFNGSAYVGTLAGTASDPDTGDALTYSLISSPTWLAVATDGTLTGTPVTANLGLNSFTVRVTDSDGLWDEAILEIEVGAANAVPVFASDPLVYPAATALASYTGHSLASSATDGDNDPITFTKLSGPAWLSVASNGTLSGTPAIGDIGANEFSVRVSDPAGGQSGTTLSIAVSEPYFLYDINGNAAGSGAAAGGTWNGSAQWTTAADGSAATIAWINGAIPVFSAGTDAAGDYTVNNTSNRTIRGFVARTGTPRVTGSALELLSAASTFTVESSAVGARVDATLSSSGGLVKNGPGTLVLGASNSYLGNTTITAGILELASGAKLYNAGYNNNAVITIAAGGTWRLPDFSYAGVGQLADYRQRRVLDGGTIEITGNSHTSGQDFTVNATGGTIRYAAAGQTLTLSGNNNSNINTSGPLTFDAVGNISVSGGSAILEGSGSVVKTGGGDLTLGNAGNSIAGHLTVNAGRLIASATSNSANTSLGAKNPARVITVNAPGSMEWTNSNILGGGGMTAAALPALALNGSSLKTTRFNVIGNATFTGASLVNSNATDPVTYDGFQFIGTITAAGTAPSAITTTTAKGNHLLGGGTSEFAVTDAAGSLTISTILRNGSNDYLGTASLRKTGSGTLTLSATNAYSGTTTVEAGTLAIEGSTASATTVADTGKLSGSGTVNAAVTIGSGGTLAPNPAATLTTGALTLASGSTLLADGRVSVSGNVDLTGAQVVTTVGGPRVLVSFTGTRSGDFATATLPAGWEIEIDDTAKEIRLIATATGGYDAWIDGFATGGESGFTQDADHDGTSNGLEFYLGGDPTIAGDSPAPILLAATGGGFTFNFTRADRARSTVNAIIQLSDDMAVWPQAREIVIGLATESSGPGVTITANGDHDIVSVVIPEDTIRTFIRLGASKPSSP